jgi:hypothetical protein
MAQDSGERQAQQQRRQRAVRTVMIFMKNSQNVPNGTKHGNTFVNILKTLA